MRKHWPLKIILEKQHISCNYKLFVYTLLNSFQLLSISCHFSPFSLYFTLFPSISSPFPSTSSSLPLSPSPMLRQLLTTALLLVTYWVNYLSSSGQLGETMMNLREVFPFPYMPAGWTFGIARSAIYLALGVWCVWSWSKHWKNNEKNNTILPRFWISSVLNIFWIFATAREWYAISVIIIATLMVVLWKILWILKWSKNIRQTIPFGLYAWWITMATTIVGISQFVFVLINNQRPLTTRRTTGVIALGVCVAGWLFWKHRNWAQLLITVVALGGVAASLFG